MQLHLQLLVHTAIAVCSTVGAAPEVSQPNPRTYIPVSAASGGNTSPSTAHKRSLPDPPPARLTRCKQPI